MGSLRAFTVVLASLLTISPLMHAQTAPAPNITLPAGDAARGKALFESTSKGNCLSCHKVNGNGSLFGPDLSSLGAGPRGGGGAARGGGVVPAAPAPAAGIPLPAPPGTAPAGGRGGQPGQGGNAGGGPTLEQLAQSLLDPNAAVSAQNRYVALKMKDGKTITGKLLSIDTFNVQIFDSSEKLANINKDNLREMTMTSPMPSYRDKLTTQELADVIGYLMSLKGQ